MKRAHVGARVRHVNRGPGGAPGSAGRALSVAEMQQALREMRRLPAAPTAPLIRAGVASGRRPIQGSPDTARAGEGQTPNTPSCAGGWTPDTTRQRRVEGPDAVRPSEVDGAAAGESARRAGWLDAALPRDWIAVGAAHAGAGASTTALALADALSAAGRRVRVFETAAAQRSGLATATCAELGCDPTGAWRLGSRHRATLYRRAHDTPPRSWPGPARAAEPPPETVVDLGLCSPGVLARLAAAGCPVVLVCRATVPGTRLTEQVLAELDAVLAVIPVVVAAVGPARWPGRVAASAGDGLRAARAGGRVVAVPEDRRLAVTGPSAAPLPRPVATAGRALLALLENARPGGAPMSAAPPAPPAEGPKR